MVFLTYNASTTFERRQLSACRRLWVAVSLRLKERWRYLFNNLYTFFLNQGFDRRQMTEVCRDKNLFNILFCFILSGVHSELKAIQYTIHMTTLFFNNIFIVTYYAYTME